MNIGFLQALQSTLRSADMTDGWISLVRETDPIGGQVLSWNPKGRAGRSLTTERLNNPLAIDNDDRAVADKFDTATGVRKCGPEWRLPDPMAADSCAITFDAEGAAPVNAGPGDTGPGDTARQGAADSGGAARIVAKAVPAQ